MSTLNPSEQEGLRKVVEAFFGKADTAHWEMNEELLKVVTTMINESKSCSQAMDFVPRPGVYLSPKDVQKELARMAKRVLGRGSSYWVCNVFVARQWKMEAAIAAQGAKSE
jgi:hypothetical protein